LHYLRKGTDLIKKLQSIMGDSLGASKHHYSYSAVCVGKKRIGFFFLTLAGPEATTGVDDDEASTFFIPETQKN
jgi:hypothetical protein